MKISNFWMIFYVILKSTRFLPLHLQEADTVIKRAVYYYETGYIIISYIYQFQFAGFDAFEINILTGACQDPFSFSKAS